MKLKIYNGRKYFYQYDHNQKLILDGDLPLTDLHFVTDEYDKAVCMPVYDDNSVKVCDVPDKLLETYGKLTVYGWIDEYTVIRFVFKIVERKQPDDFVPASDIVKWTELDERITELEEKEVEIDLSNYYTKEETDNTFLKVIPGEYITEDELNAKGYLTEHQDLTGYAKKSDIPTDYAKANHEHSEYLKEMPTHSHDWNDIGTGDTLTWDGNTSGLNILNDMFYKVYNGTVTVEDLTNFIIVTSDGNTITKKDCVFEVGDDSTLIGANGLPLVACIHQDVVNGGLTLMEKGLYFVSIEGIYVSSFAIEGYTGFPSQIPAGFIPPHTHEWKDLGESATGEDTLTWDGNTTGLPNIENTYYKVADIPPLSAIAQGGSLTNIDGTFNFVSDDLKANTSSVATLRESIVFVLQDNAKIILGEKEIIVPERGIYFVNVLINGINLINTSLTLNGYTGFPSVKRLDEKYMPLLTSPDGSQFKITVANDGTLSATKV